MDYLLTESKKPENNYKQKKKQPNYVFRMQLLHSNKVRDVPTLVVSDCAQKKNAHEGIKQIK